MKNKKVLIAIITIIVILVAGLVIFILTRPEKPIKEDYTGEKFTLDAAYYNKGEYIQIDSDKVKELVDNKKTFLLFTYNNYCNFPVPCDSIFQEVMDKYKIDVLKIPFDKFKDTDFYETVKFAPSLMIIKEGKIIDYLKADEDGDMDKYQDVKAFRNWLNSYIVLKK